jgi:hypothetical protein
LNSFFEFRVQLSSACRTGPGEVFIHIVTPARCS